jgi:hypothetical protein
MTRRELRERHRQELRRRRRARLRTALAPMCILVGTSLLIAGATMETTPTMGAGSSDEVPLASPSTMAALAAGWQPPPRLPRPVEVAEPKEAPGEELPEADTGEEASAPPVAVQITRIDVRSALIDLDLDEDRRLEVPSDPDLAGWFVRGPRPGQPGPAVIAGHVDSRRGPGVFHRLRELEPGDEVVVHRADGSEVRFVVQRLGRWPKDAFPTDAVYREAAGPELRLITCGGTFDRRSRRYEDNIIVFATARPHPEDNEPEVQ